MLKRILPAAILVGCLFLQASPVRATTVFAQIFPLTGEIRLVNRTTSPLAIVFYSIESNSGALNPSASVWKSISDNYDAPAAPSPGNGFVDPNFAWMKISATSTQLTEGAFAGPGGILLPWRPVSLGRVWNPNLTPFSDLEFDIRSQTETYDVFDLPSLDGDYWGDGVVNQIDYNFWRRDFGSTSSLLADGNIDGKIDAADYVVWRNNFGLSIPASGGGAAVNSSPSLSVAVVPEPNTVVLSLIAVSGFALSLKRRAR